MIVWRVVVLAVAMGAMVMVGAGAEGRTTERIGSDYSSPYSEASNAVVQPQPAAGSCRVRGSGRFSRPGPNCTPGALNPSVTQASIHRTICSAGWASTVRPPVRVTEPEKLASMAAYGDHRSANHYEYDHLVPLELGGATNDRRNLWPEPGASPNPKDSVENALNHKVCDGKMTLARARRLIARNWVAVYHSLYDKSSRHSSPPPASPVPYCRVNASYSSSYTDWDVYIHSNQPDKKATVTDSHGRSASWTTDENGYADVYFHAPRSAAGESIRAHFGSASCSASL